MLHSRIRTIVAAVVLAAVGVSLPAAGASRRAPASGVGDLTTVVNPLAGTLGAGFPTVAAGVPFGAITPGPATVFANGEDPVNYVGYGYQDTHIRGFALAHYDGAGVHIGGELPMMPTTGPVTSDPTQFSTPFSHLQEVARPGYYSVTLSKYQTTVEITATTRAAVERLTYPRSEQSNFLFDVSRHNDGLVPASLQMVDARTVTGSVFLPDGKGFMIWFTARFNQPMTSFGTWMGASLNPGSGTAVGKGAGGWATFDTTKNPVIEARIGLSYVDARGATANLDAEAPARTSFESIREAARAQWNARLHAIDVTGGFGDQRGTFYTNLYRAFLMPTTADDPMGATSDSTQS